MLSPYRRRDSALFPWSQLRHARSESALAIPQPSRNWRNAARLCSQNERAAGKSFFPGRRRPGSSVSTPLRLRLPPYGTSPGTRHTARTCARIVLQPPHIREIAEGAGKVRGIAQVLPDRDTPLEQQAKQPGSRHDRERLRPMRSVRRQRRGYLSVRRRCRDSLRTVAARKRSRPAHQTKPRQQTADARAVSDAPPLLPSRAAGRCGSRPSVRYSRVSQKRNSAAPRRSPHSASPVLIR